MTEPAPLTEDQLSGRKFVRWNAVTLLIALVALGAGALVPRAPREGGKTGVAPPGSRSS